MGVCARITSHLLLFIMYRLYNHIIHVYRYIFGLLMLIHIVIICAIFVVLAGCVMKFNASLDATSLGWASGGAVNNSRRIVAREQMKWHDLWCYIIIHYYLLFYIIQYTYYVCTYVYTPYVCAFNIEIKYKLYIYNIRLNRWPRNVPWYTTARPEAKTKWNLLLLLLLLQYYYYITWKLVRGNE